MAEAKDLGGAVVGATVPFLDAPEKAAGEPLYLDDLRLPGMLVGRALRSEHAHARILSVNAADARRVQGAAAVLTGADLPGAPRFLPHERSTPLIARDRARYMGEVVALVAAGTGEAAEEALRRIRVKYEPLPVVDDPRDAMAKGAPRLWPGGNLLNHAKIRTGDLEAGFRAADVVVEGEYRTPPVDHLYLEVEAACAMPLPGGSYQVWGCTQQPFLVRERVAHILGLRGERAVRFIQTLPGGAFGGKSEASVDVCLRAAVLARATGKPVKLVYSREESMIASAKRHGAIIRSRLGAARDGRLTAAEVEVYLDKGAYAAAGGIILPPSNGPPTTRWAPTLCRTQRWTFFAFTPTTPTAGRCAAPVAPRSTSPASSRWTDSPKISGSTPSNFGASTACVQAYEHLGTSASTRAWA